NSGRGSEWVRLSPPLPAIRNLRPTEPLHSYRSTPRPAWRRRSAANRPAGPPPTTATRGMSASSIPALSPPRAPPPPGRSGFSRDRTCLPTPGPPRGSGLGGDPRRPPARWERYHARDHTQREDADGRREEPAGLDPARSAAVDGAGRGRRSLEPARAGTRAAQDRGGTGGPGPLQPRPARAGAAAHPALPAGGPGHRFAGQAARVAGPVRHPRPQR